MYINDEARQYHRRWKLQKKITTEATKEFINKMIEMSKKYSYFIYIYI